MTEQPPPIGPEPARERVPSRLLVHTGDGKGKSSAAMGIMLRAISAGWSVGVVQFVKSGRWRSGEEQAARTLGVDWWTLGDGFTWDSQDLQDTEAAARSAWKAAKELITAGNHRLVILDEITYPMNWSWISTDQVVEVLEHRPADVSVVATGREAPQQLCAIADTVTEMMNIKHAFDRGIGAMRGIEF